MRYRTLRTHRLAGLGNRLRHVGHGRLDRIRRQESLRALDRALALGCNFFDTAWAYGQGKSEELLGQALRAHRGVTAVSSRPRFRRRT